MDQGKAIELDMPLQSDFLPIAAGCVEDSVLAYGLGRTEAMSLRLAVEEVYAFLADRAPAGQRLTLQCRNGVYYAEVTCRFPGQGLPVDAFNVTSTVSSEDEQSLAEMGLLLAARTVDRLEIEAKGGLVRIHFIKEKKYPSGTGDLGDFSPQGNCREVAASAEMMKQFAQRVEARYAGKALPCVAFPGKVADMVGCGEFDAVLLADEQDHVCAGMFWRYGNKLAEAYGPYIFCSKGQLAVQAVEACLCKLARTSVVCMVVHDPTPETPAGYFEQLSEDGSLLYRQLEEDNGATAYASTELAGFLRESYKKLCLPRDVQQVEYQGETLSLCSAFASRMDRAAARVALTSIWVGQDARKVLQDHVRALTQEGFTEIRFHLDTGEAEQALLGPALAAAGFTPLRILPWGGRGDLLVLAHAEESGK